METLKEVVADGFIVLVVWFMAAAGALWHHGGSCGKPEAAQEKVVKD